MKAVVWHGVGDIRLEDVPEPDIEEPTDAVIRITTSAICGTRSRRSRPSTAGRADG